MVVNKAKTTVRKREGERTLLRKTRTTITKYNDHEISNVENDDNDVDVDEEKEEKESKPHDHIDEQGYREKIIGRAQK